MSIIQSVVLGALQGLAEFLPISSSGHLVVIKHLFGLEEVPQLFDIILHLGTLAAVLLVFWKPILAILGAMVRWFTKKNTEADKEYLSLVVPAIIATVFTAGIGLAVHKLNIEPSPKSVAVLWIVTGCLLIGVSFIKGSKTYASMSWREGVLIGIAQGLGTLPGISRSGITIAGGLVGGLKREYAGEFAFLLAIPAIVGAFVLEIKDVEAMSAVISLTVLITGFVISFIVGFIALKLLIPIVKKGQLYWFACYLIPAGIAGLIFL